MELAASAEPFFCPLAAFLDPRDSPMLDNLQPEVEKVKEPVSSPLIWSRSSLNPKNRIDNLEESHNPAWRLDRISSLGRQFSVVPIFLYPKLRVRRIDVLIPCQSKHPAPLRRLLQSSEAYNWVGQGVGTLGIAKYVLLVLDVWSKSQKYFFEVFHAMPFGSKIIIENIALNLKDVRVRFLPNHDHQKLLLPLHTLRHMWSDVSDWPPVIDLDFLAHEAQPHDTVSLVKIPSLHGSRTFVFKSSLRRQKYLYHELKLLLTMSSHPCIIAKPLYVVTQKDSASQENYVLGFVLEYHSSGSLRQIIETWSMGDAHFKHLKYHWSKQIIETLIDISKGSTRFYSELKPDNLVVSDTNANITFIDFEQAGNWDTFSAPEIIYIEHIARLTAISAVPAAKRNYYEDLLKRNSFQPVAFEEVYSNPEHGYYEAWTSMKIHQQEAAMVYSVGKILWCLFEELSHTTNSLEENYNTKIPFEFPRFRRCSRAMRRIIELCTAGSPDWTAESIRIEREGPELVARWKSTADERVSTSPIEIMKLSKSMWIDRIEKMESYLEARVRWLDGQASLEDENLLGFPLRPRLAEVLAMIRNVEQTSDV